MVPSKERPAGAPDSSGYAPICGSQVEPEALRLLAETAMTDIAHLLRPGHLQQLANILKDPEASKNDRFVALELLKNANVAAGMVLPGCQDTGAC